MSGHRLHSSLAITFNPRVLLATACCVAMIAGARAAADDGAAEARAEGNPHLWKPRTTSVTVFKNGMGFFMREGKVALRDGWCAAEEIPPAAFGTLMTYSHVEGEFIDVVGAGPGEIVEFDGRDAPRDAAAIRERLDAALLLRVELSYRYQGADRTAAGKLISVGPEFAILEHEGGTHAVPVAGISKMQMLDLPLRVHVAAEEPRPAPTETTLGMSYLRQGITWIPEYSLEVLDDETAQLTLRGTLVNEAEDLIRCDVNLVVGVPHFVHQDYLTPAAVGQRIRTIGAAMAPADVRTQIMSRAAIVSNSITANQFEGAPAVRDAPVAAAAGDLRAAVGNLPQLDGGAGSDFTVYTKPDVTLRRGEKAIITIFRTKIRYTHGYRWNTAQALEHYFALHNDGATAWTTGPCLAVADKQPLTEDLLKYTPKAGVAQLPVTTAVNIAHRKTEQEADRRIKAENPTSGVFLDLVTIEGRIELRNFEKRDVEIEIVNPVPGRPVSAGDEGTRTVDPTNLELLKLVGEIRWKVDLKAGESKTLTYRYERYVRSY